MHNITRNVRIVFSVMGCVGLLTLSLTGHADDWREKWRKQWRENEAHRNAAQKKAKATHPKAKPASAAKTSAASAANVPAKPAPAIPANTPVSAPPTPGTTPTIKPPVAQEKPAAPVAALTKPRAAANTPKPATPSPEPAKSAAKPAPNALYNQTKPDPFDLGTSSAPKPQSSPVSAIGDSGRLMVLLLPMLALVVGGLHLLRRYREKNGQLPGPLQRFENAPVPATAAPTKGLSHAWFGSLRRSVARPGNGSSMQVIESLPLGPAALHLVEVRGKTLLLGATATNLSLLTEISDTSATPGNEFRRQLQAASEDLGSLDFTDTEAPLDTLVASLESVMRETQEAVEDRTRRLRTSQKKGAKTRE